MVQNTSKMPVPCPADETSYVTNRTTTFRGSLLKHYIRYKN